MKKLIALISTKGKSKEQVVKEVQEAYQEHEKERFSEEEREQVRKELGHLNPSDEEVDEILERRCQKGDD
ncbi:hypothetical protein KKC44_05980 [Patescibacteria group bacterium]|nr:hypothetical protein [Patescibacteria group bacterium]MBU2260121.1 hypothetical protein [Patescibacteria group bacterium]